MGGSAAAGAVHLGGLAGSAAAGAVRLGGFVAGGVSALTLPVLAAAKRRVSDEAARKNAVARKNAENEANVAEDRFIDRLAGAPELRWNDWDGTYIFWPATAGNKPENCSS